MNKTSSRISLFVIILMLPWTAIYAAGLGKLTLNSALGQPLNAEIDIVTTNSDEISSLNASIATQEAFAQAGINYESNFSTFRISVQSKANGTPYIKLTSPQAVNDPFLNILVELNWSAGRILREYAVLLDPVEASTQAIAAPDVSHPPVVTTQKETERTSDVRKNTQNDNAARSGNYSAKQARDTYGPVIPGDNLSLIARQFLPAGVDLNQMLVALYHANRDAFIANNMNLLRVGAMLKIPEKNEVAAIDASTAKAEIRMQVKDWHNYQVKIAAASSESPDHADIRQSDQGKITTTIDKKSVSTRESPKEVLRLSGGAPLTDKDGQIPDAALADRLRMMEEDAVARNLALQEANQRVAMLEKSIQNLKQLLELKDSVLAQAQVKANSASSMESKAEIQLIEAINSSPENVDSLQAQEQNIPITQSANEAATKDTEAKPLPVQETEDQSLTDQLFSNIEYIGAALISLLLVTWLILRKRRNQSAEDAELGERDTNFSSAIQARMASMAAVQTASATINDHSFSESEKHDLTYENLNAYPEAEKYGEGFDKEPAYYAEHAEQIKKSESETGSISELSDESKELPTDSRSNNPAFDSDLREDAKENYDQSIDSLKHNDAMDFASEIDSDLTDEANEIKQNLPEEQFEHDVEKKTEFSESSTNSQKAINVSDYELEIDSDDSKHSLSSINSENTLAEKDNTIEFTHSDIDLTEESLSNKTEIPKINLQSTSPSSDLSDHELRDETLEFDQHQAVEKNMRPESMPDMTELKLADINLDIEDSNSVDEKNEVSDLDGESEQWQEVETKLDLAKAYQEMDDKVGAKEILEEVIRDGDAEQKKAASNLLKTL